MTEINIDIRTKKLVSAYIDAPFDEGTEALTKEGYKIISLEENARLRMHEGKNSYVSKNANWVSQGVIYVPNKGIFLTKNSPILLNAKKATDCHRAGKEFYLTSQQVEESLFDSAKLEAEAIPTNRFGEDEITVYAFGDWAKQYGEFLKAAGINQMLIFLANNTGNPFARQVWFWNLDAWSGINGYNWDMYYNDIVRGVCEVPKDDLALGAS